MKTKYSRGTVKILLGYVWPRGEIGLKIRLCLSLGCLLAAKSINVYVPFLFKAAVDDLTTRPLQIPLTIIATYGLARIAQQTFSELREFFFARVAQRAQRSVALATFKHLHRLSLRFHLDRQTGGLTRVIERGTRAVQNVLTFTLFNIIPTLLEIALVALILQRKFGWTFAITALVTVVTYLSFTLSLTRFRTRFRRSMNERDTAANSRAIDTLLNYETVKYFGNEQYEYRDYDDLLGQYQGAALKSQSLLSFLNVGQGLIVGSGLVSLMALAARGVVVNTMTVGDFVLVNTLLIQLFIPLNYLGFVYREVSQGLIDMEKMFTLLEEPLEIKDKEDAKILSSSRVEVEFRDVQFSYQPERAILRGISFKISAGRTVALVGPSGSGKSTIARLLFRFYDVSAGSIRVAGHDVRDLAQGSLRQAIGVVPQDTVLFNESMLYNIAYGRPGSTAVEIEAAAEGAQIDRFIKTLPLGYETRVGERGLKLSGGEKQRVAIARTILKGPPILVLDEATSALDSRTEREIQATLNELARERTTLIIAHRLSTVVHADEILVLVNGLIVERGTHGQLVGAGGEYAAMWERQARTEVPALEG